MKPTAKQLARQLPKQLAKQLPSNPARYFKLARVPGASARAFPTRPDPYPQEHFGSDCLQTNPNVTHGRRIGLAIP